MKRAIFLLAFALPALSQTPLAGPQWKATAQRDQLRDVNFTVFELEGKYLEPPRDAKPDAKPSLILRCQAHAKPSVVLGSFLSGYIFLGDSTMVTSGVGGVVLVEFKLDDGKLQSATWSRSTDFSSVFFGGEDLDNFLYGHFLFHKPNTNPPVKRLIVGIDEAAAAEVQVEFDFPDPTTPTDVADVCGAVMYRKKQQPVDPMGATPQVHAPTGGIQ